ncbi:MAG: hypothetical protein ACM3TR_06260 [Caulobacteraceae bacterium]
MQHGERKTLIWAVMAMVILAIPNITQFNSIESKEVLQKKEPPVKQTNVVADTVYNYEGQLL